MSTLQTTINNFGKATVLVVGDIMLDEYVYGDVEKISPEAPIPVLKINHKREMLGGAGNVVRNLHSLGASIKFIGVVGNDNSADKIDEQLKPIPNLDYHLEKEDSIPTIVKTRFVSQNHQLLRTDIEEQITLSVTIENKIIQWISSKIDKCNVIIISDYNKGTISNRIGKEVIKLANAKQKPIFVDPKGKDYSKYREATLIKPNKKELLEFFPEVSQGENDFISLSKKISIELDIKYCLTTLGKDGLLLVGQDQEVKLSALKREVFDVSGAGDTVIATLAVAYASGGSINNAVQLANYAAGIVVSKTGTAVVSPAEIRNEIEVHKRVYTIDDILRLIQEWRKNKYTIGFTNGCFDLIHSGHISTLKFAKENCDKLIVGLNSDTSVKILKGKNRPIKNESERALIISEFNSVDAVVLFDNETPVLLIESIRPDILVKGSDYNHNTIVGASFVESYGGKVLAAPLVAELSSTIIIEKIKNSNETVNPTV